MDTDGENCFLKSACDGTPGVCRMHECGYRRSGVGPQPPAPPAPPVPPAPPGITLRQAAAKTGMFIGAATNVAGLQNTAEPKYKVCRASRRIITPRADRKAAPEPPSGVLASVQLWPPRCPARLVLREHSFLAVVS